MGEWVPKFRHDIYGINNLINSLIKYLKEKRILKKE